MEHWHMSDKRLLLPFLILLLLLLHCKDYLLVLNLQFALCVLRVLLLGSWEKAFSFLVG